MHRRPPAPDAQVVVEAENLSLYHEKQPILSGLDFTLKKGSITALVGKNGSGKSTLLCALAGVGKHRGKLKVNGSVGLVFQNPRFQFLALTVENEVLTTLKAADPKASPAELSKRAEELMGEFALMPYRSRSPYELSQGQQRRLALLAMMAGNRDIMLLDEPTYAQDERSTRFIIELLEKRVAQGMTAVIATHDLSLAQSCADRILLLEDGVLSEPRREEFHAYVSERSVPTCGR